MGNESRKQVYPFQYKVNSVSNAQLCAFGHISYTVMQLALFVPDNMLAMTNLWMHIVIQYNTSEPTANKTLSQITLGSVNGVYSPAFNGTVYNLPTTGVSSINVQADSNSVINYAVSLQSLLPYIYLYPSTATNSQYFQISIIAPTLVNSATINVWKTDMTYTTQGIR